MIKVKFVKMHGIGNDFILINDLNQTLNEAVLPDFARKLNDRKFGVGGDGLILVLPSKHAQFRMRMFNPDGSEAQMCGNGIRCFGKYLYDRQLLNEPKVNVETGAGILSLKLTVEGDKAVKASVDMGEPRLQRQQIPMTGDPTETCINQPIALDGAEYYITAVSMGNPHIVLFTDEVQAIDLTTIGHKLERHSAFPERTNVHFVQINSRNELTMRTWERGAGITLACGTGACACVVASSLNNKTSRNVLAHLPGGDLDIVWQEDNRVIMTGPAVEVFEGEIKL